MNALSKLKVNDSDIQGERDVVGGSAPWESGLYPVEVTMAYLTSSSKGSLGLVLSLENETGGKHTSTLYMTTGDAKGNVPYSINDKGEKKFLTGYNQANSLCLLTVGKEIGDMETEEKVINIYNYDAKADVPTKVQVLTDLLGRKIIVGIQKQLVSKRAQGADGQYVATAETREQNEIDKFFRASDKLTTAEILAGAVDESGAAFYKTWDERFSGKVRDRTEKPTGGVATGAFGKAAAGAGGKPTKSLFAAG
jgi:hypothetical protein